MNSLPASALDKPLAADTKAYYRVLALVGVGFFVQTLTMGIAGLPILFLLKKQLHLHAADVAFFGLVTGIAWYLKPIAGAIADTTRLFGTRYRHFLLFSSGGAAISWAIMGMMPPKYVPLLITYIVVNVFLMISSTVLGGFMVTESQAFQATGRLGSFRNNAMTAGGLIAGPISGFLAARWFGWTGWANAAMLAIMIIFIFIAVREVPVKGSSDGPTPWQKLRQEFAPVLQAKPFWAAVAMIFLIQAMPGFGTLLTFYMTDVLHFKEQFIGNLSLYGGVTGLVGGFVYIYMCRHISLRVMLAISIVVGAAGTIIYLWFQSPLSAIVISVVNGLLGSLASVAVFDLAARASPARSASLAYSLLMAVSNFGVSLGNTGGSWLHDRFHVQLSTLIWISTLTTLVTVVAIPFLPRALVETSDGEKLPAEANDGER